MTKLQFNTAINWNKVVTCFFFFNPQKLKALRIWNYETSNLVGRRTHTTNQQFQRCQVAEGISITSPYISVNKEIIHPKIKWCRILSILHFTLPLFFFGKTRAISFCWFNDKQSNCHSKQHDGIWILLEASTRLHTMEGTIQLNKDMLMGSKINWNYSG